MSPGTNSIKVKLSWCHNGVPKTKVFTRGETESEGDFNERVASEAFDALDAEKPTGDCVPPFP